MSLSGWRNCSLERHMRDDAIVVFRHAAEDGLDLPPLLRYDERAYGGMKLEFLKR